MKIPVSRTRLKITFLESHPGGNELKLRRYFWLPDIHMYATSVHRKYDGIVICILATFKSLSPGNCLTHCGLVAPYGNMDLS